MNAIAALRFVSGNVEAICATRAFRHDDSGIASRHARLVHISKAHHQGNPEMPEFAEAISDPTPAFTALRFAFWKNAGHRLLLRAPSRRIPRERILDQVLGQEA
jgi:hypothetical protein